MKASREASNVSSKTEKKFVLIIPDGAADRHRIDGKSPLTTARIDGSHFIAREGVCGLLQTLYPDLSKSSIVAQLGMLGWDPYTYYPHGRASCELLALDNVALSEGDLVFRANLVTMKGGKLESYNGKYILSEQSMALVDRINSATRACFPAFELHHNSDFRNSLVIRDARVDPRAFICAEPHESEGVDFALDGLIRAKEDSATTLAQLINKYLACVGSVLADEAANMLFPWSPSLPLALPSFADNTGFQGKVGIVGCMDFLHGIAKAGGMDFYKVGNGRPDTDYVAKGATVIALLEAGYNFVICHVNGPDEASHMGSLPLKIQCLERLDEHIVQPVVKYFCQHRAELGGVMIAPDHYTNHSAQGQGSRGEAHSIEPVPFALWNDRDKDHIDHLGEDAARHGRYGGSPVSHLDLLRILGVAEARR